MTDAALAPIDTAWNTAVDRYRSARADWQRPLEPHNRAVDQAHSDRYIAAEQALLALHAPTIAAAIEKLEIIWEDDMQNDSPESAAKTMVVQDLRGLRIKNGAL